MYNTRTNRKITEKHRPFYYLTALLKNKFVQICVSYVYNKISNLNKFL